jgi:uncharacterized 2Fe-2S/4Fe-4S cluster protein (DUF4445 family)
MPFLTLLDDGTGCGIPFTPGQSVREILDATGTRVRSGCNGSGACGLCRIRIEKGDVPGPTGKERYLIDETRLSRGVRLACQVVPEGDIAVEILSPARKSSWRSIPAELLYHSTVGYEIPDPPGDADPECGDTYGIAIDLGTTQISLSLLSLRNGRRLAVRCGRNPQGEAGSDVMTRLVAAAGSEKRAGEMSEEVVRAIGQGILDITSREGLDPGRVRRLAVVGNTAMLTLLTRRNYELLVRPETWMGTIDCMPEDTSTWKTAWEIPAGAITDVLPPAGGFVGSDLLAGVLATGLAESIRPGLLIDFGTNSEIALWDGRTLFVTSAAGGPAFEGCGIRCGLPAEPGAICRVRFRDGFVEFLTIAGDEPRGICGTGIVDLIAGLVRSGILTEKGQFAPAHAGGFVPDERYPLITLEKRDVDVFQRAKAAIGTGIQVLMDKAGLGYPELDRVYVGGTFGKSLDPLNAAAIGLLPPVLPDRIELCGNTALAGCELTLISPSADTRLRRTAERVRTINIAGHRNFDDIYLENLYLRPLEGR